MFPKTFLSFVWHKIKSIFSCCCTVKSKGKDFTWINSFEVDKAPEPEDIIWENLSFSNSDRLLRKVKTYTYSILLTIVNLGILLGLNYAQVIL